MTNDQAKGCSVAIVAAAFCWLIILLLVLAAITWWPW